MYDNDENNDYRKRVNITVTGALPKFGDHVSDIQREIYDVLKKHGVSVGIASVQESSEIIDRDPYDSKSPENVYTPHQVRCQVFDRMLEVAKVEANSPVERSIEERCLRTVHGVLDVIDAGGGNKPDGQGLPLFQLLLSPHPDYTEGRERAGLPAYDTTVPFDCGLVGGENNTGLAHAFADRYDSVRGEMAKKAMELFD